MKGKKAFEYLLNIKYFNNPTNNVDYVKKLPPNPDIPIDEKANSSTDKHSLELNSNNNDNMINDVFNESKKFYDDNLNNKISQVTQNMLNERSIQDTKLNTLLKMKRK